MDLGDGWSGIADFFGTTHHDDGTTTYGLGTNFLNELYQGFLNWWYQTTGQTEKTSAYQAMLEHEDNAPQKFIESLTKAGLSKYSYNGGQVGTPNAPASDPVGQQMARQELKSLKLANKEAEHNLSVSKQLGIRTGDTNFAAKWAELGNVLFGFDPTNVDGGLIPWLFRKLSDFFGFGGDDGDSGSGSGNPLGFDFGIKGWNSPFSDIDEGIVKWLDSRDENRNKKAYDAHPVFVGASYDEFKGIKNDMNKLVEQGPEAVEKFVGDIIRKVESEGFGKTAGYSTLPDGKKLGIYGTYEGDLRHFIDDMQVKNVFDDFSIDRIAEVLSNKYGKKKSDVVKDLKDGITFIVEGR